MNEKITEHHHENTPIPTPHSKEDLKKNHRYTGTIEKSIFGGKGIIFVDGFSVLIKKGIEGQTIVYQISKLKKNYAEGVIEEIVSPSPLEIRKSEQKNELPGCVYQNIRYEDQLRIKHDQLQEVFRQFPKTNIPKFIPSPKQYGYRNKMEFSIGYEQMTSKIQDGKKIWTDEGVAVGFHPPKNWAQVISISDVFIAPHSFNILRSTFENALKENNCFGKNPWNALIGKGFWRELILRTSEKSGDILINIVVSSPCPEALKQNIIELFENVKLPNGTQISGIVETINPEKNSALQNPEWDTIWGDPFLEEELGNKTFQISPFSFFQTNTPGAETLYQTIADTLPQNKSGKILDLFCGTGSIGIFCSTNAKQIVGIELIPEAVEMAKKNAKRNTIENAEFFAGKAEKILPEVLQQFDFDTVIIDPPRSGMHPKALQHISEIPVPQLVYVSCNPTTLARDAEELKKNGWLLKQVQGVDMFPHTPHMEVVSVFEQE